MNFKMIKPFCSLALLVVLPLAGGPAESLDVLSGGYPRAFFFRTSETTAAEPRNSFEQWEQTFARLMGIDGKVLDEEIPGRSIRNLGFFTRFKRNHPNQLVMLHYNGNARSPLDHTEKYFAGHWLYFGGARILSDIPETTAETEIRVSDPKLFLVNMGRYGTAKEDIGICELNADGKPDWYASEQVKLVSVDEAKGVLRVRRGIYGTKPRSFRAGRAYAAAHATEGPWGASPDNPLLWNYNHATTCPRDRNGKNCNDILAEELAAHFAPGGALATFDGLEFDVLTNSIRVTTAKGRKVDADADGKPDGGIVGGVNVYGAGNVDFAKNLVAKLGPGRLVLADGWNAGNQRAFGVLNGVETEGFPSLNDYQVNDWSGGLNRQRFWAENSRAPRFSYVNHKFVVGGEKPGDSKLNIPFNIHRLVFSGAVFTDFAICFSLQPKQTGDELVGIWDELWMGAEHKPGWLGQPVAPAVHLAARKPNLLASSSLPKSIQGAGVMVESNHGVRISAANPAAAEVRFLLKDIPLRGPDLFVTLTARAARSSSMPAEAGRLIRVGLAGSSTATSPAWVKASDFQYTYYFPNAGGDKADLEIQVESGEPVWISSASAHAHPDAMYREFEHGLVLANPSPRPYTFDIAGLLPGKRFRRLKGSPGQDPATNNGAAVAAQVTLGPKDALFLVKVED